MTTPPAHPVDQAPDAPPPAIVCPTADAEFSRLCRQHGYDPASVWVGGYVRREWRTIRHVIVAFIDPAGRQMLEFGCNFGATAIVLAHMGAAVEGVDVNNKVIEIARQNVLRYGCQDRVNVHLSLDTRRLPWPDGRFDAIVCNSVLEYVPLGMMVEVLAELGRVLKPGGLLFVLSTSNRLWPREVHSKRWLVNYLPRRLDAWLGRGGRRVERGVWPGTIRRAARGYRNLCHEDGSRRYLAAKRKMGWSAFRTRAMRTLDAIVHPLGLTIGDFTPTITLILQKLQT